MKGIKIIGVTLLFTIFLQTAKAQIGKPFIHDPSTNVECDGKYTPLAQAVVD